MSAPSTRYQTRSICSWNEVQTASSILAARSSTISAASRRSSRAGAPPTRCRGPACVTLAYGTDGFAPSLLGLDERGVLAARIGGRAEAWVYLYASCDREVVYPAFGSRGSLRFRDRFTGECLMLGAGDAAVLVELTAANELDIVTVNPAWGAQMGPGLLDLLGGARHRLSDAAWEACTSTLGGTARSTPSTS
jgi:hypothetical protein